MAFWLQLQMADTGSSQITAAVGVFLISLLGVPAAKFVNTAQTLSGELGLLVSGITSLLIISVLTYFALHSFKQKKDWLFYVFALSTFSSCVDILLALESDGIISGFMSSYLKNGEPYLNTPFGTMICLWDGTGHYALYVVMLAAMACGWQYRDVGLYWVGSIGHSMIVLIPGALLSDRGARWSFFLNMPYIIIPIVSAARFLRERKQSTACCDQPGCRKGWLQCLVDAVLAIFLVISTIAAFVRGFYGVSCENRDIFITAVLGSHSAIPSNYLLHVEPYLNDPVAFPKVQMLVFMFYFVPFYVGAIYCLGFNSSCSWLRDWSIIFAGAAAQAQVAHIGGSLHSRTLAEYRVPDDARTIFWAVNLIILIVPHILAARCWLQSTADDSASVADARTGSRKKLA